MAHSSLMRLIRSRCVVDRPEFLEAGKKRLAGDTAALSEQIYTDAIGF